MNNQQAKIIQNAAEHIRIWKEAAAMNPPAFKRLMVNGHAPRAVIRRIRADLDMIERELGQ